MRKVKNNSNTCKNVIFQAENGGPYVELWWRPDMSAMESEGLAWSLSL